MHFAPWRGQRKSSLEGCQLHETTSRALSRGGRITRFRPPAPLRPRGRISARRSERSPHRSAGARGRAADTPEGSPHRSGGLPSVARVHARSGSPIRPPARARVRRSRRTAGPERASPSGPAPAPPPHRPEVADRVRRLAAREVTRGCVRRVGKAPRAAARDCNRNRRAPAAHPRAAASPRRRPPREPCLVCNGNLIRRESHPGSRAPVGRAWNLGRGLASLPARERVSQ